MNLNKAFVLGHLTQDPQVRNLPSGQLVANFGVATNRIYYDKEKQKQEQVEFHNIVTFGRTAEIAQNYLKQGSLVLIEGRIQTRSWEDQNGNKKYKTEIIAERLQLGPKNQSQNTTSTPPPSSFPPKSKEKEEVKKEEIPTIEEEEINVKDLPL